MKKTQLIYKSIAALLFIALVIGMVSLCSGLRHKPPQGLDAEIQEINPEADLPVPNGSSENAKQPELLETEPPETDPPETEPSEMEPNTTDPEETLPEDTTEPDSSSGNNDTEEGGEGVLPGDGPEDDSELEFITSLKSKYTYDQLEHDTVFFTAHLNNGGDLTLRVKLYNSQTPQNGQTLTGDGNNYQAVLCRNETNFFTFYAKDGGVTVDEITIPVQYVARLADEDNPTIGENPPVIVTNLQGVEKLSNRNFTLTVQATAYTGSTLYSSNIEVMLDGERITGPTGGPVYEYQLYFKDPEVGDVVHHTVTVRAWDNEGNSAFVAYNFDYHFVDTGGEIGTAYIILDMTTVGLGIVDEPYTYRIKQNVPASYAVMEMLTEYGYEFTYAGTPDVGFYLRRIHSGGMMDYSDIPDNLWNKVLQDQLSMTGQYDHDSLGEFDFTQGSGWMYSVGGTVYAGKGLSTYFLNNGDTLYLRFTLAYGKDIGGYSSTGGAFGVLPTYCGKWINDTYIDMHQWGEATVTIEPTCTQNGEMSCVCSVCGDRKDTVSIPALGHSYYEVSRTDPANGNDGFVLYECEHCKEEKKETILWKEEPTIPPEPTQTG